MFNVSDNKSFLDYINEMESKLGKKIDLTSYDREVFLVLYNYNSYLEKKINSEINSKIFENLKGDSLNNFLNFFNIVRLSGNNSDIYSFGFKSLGTDYFEIKKDSVIIYKNETYKVVYGDVIGQELTSIRCQKTFEHYNFAEPVFCINAEIMFDKKGLVGEVSLETEVPKQLLLVTFEKSSSEIETDFEYRERGKSVMQSNGHSNRVKIINEIISNNVIKNVIDEEIDGFVNFTIIPNNMQNMDEAINYATEVVEYYKNEYMGVSKPNLIEINISRVLENIINEENFQEITNELVSGINTILYNSTDFVSKINILSEISNIFVKYGVKDYNINNVIVSYKFYSKHNYVDYIIENEITTNKVIHKNSVITFGILN